MTDPALQPVELLNTETHDRSQFNSGVDSLDDRPRRIAPVAAAAGTTATWVLCRGNQVVGYYALAMGSVQRSAVPSRLGRGQIVPGAIVGTKLSSPGTRLSTK